MGIISLEDSRAIVQNALGDDAFEILESETVEAGSYDSFSGKIFNLWLTIKRNDQTMSLSFFVKKYPEGSGFQTEFVRTVRSFYKESHLFDRIFDKFDTVKGKVFPRNFLAKPDEVLVFENLVEKGFVRKNAYDVLTEDECISSLTALAKFHAASVIYEVTNSKKINHTISDLLFETFFVDDRTHPGFHNLCVGINATEAIIEAYFNYVPEEVCERAFELMRLVPGKIGPSKKWHNVLNHGNLWIGNIMFSYDYQQKLESLRLVDFQCVRYCPPVLDVLLFIHLTTSHVHRETEALLIHYYNIFGRELASAQVDVNAILSWDDLKASAEELLPTALAVTILYLNIYLLPKERLEPIIKSSEEFQKFIKEDRGQLVLEVMRTDQHFRKRVSQAIADLIDYVKTH